MTHLDQAQEESGGVLRCRAVKLLFTGAWRSEKLAQSIQLQGVFMYTDDGIPCGHTLS